MPEVPVEQWICDKLEIKEERFKVIGEILKTIVTELPNMTMKEAFEQLDKRVENSLEKLAITFILGYQYRSTEVMQSFVEAVSTLSKVTNQRTLTDEEDGETKKELLN